MTAFFCEIQQFQTLKINLCKFQISKPFECGVFFLEDPVEKSETYMSVFKKAGCINSCNFKMFYKVQRFNGKIVTSFNAFIT